MATHPSNPPARLHDRWDALCARVGAFGASDESDLTFEMLQTLYGHPPRTYHNLDHIAWVLGVFDTVRMLAEDRDAVEFALWLHDCVFFPERSDNEARSADAAGMIAGLLGCPGEFVAKVRDFIMVTRHDLSPPPGDAALVGDVDLSILGAPAADYEKYRRSIRTEFAFASDEQFRAGRIAFLERMLGRSSVFSTAYFRSEREELARENLRRELDDLS